MREKIYTLDTTLRDGLQGVGVTLSLDERLRLAQTIADLGIDYIEAGFIGSNPTTERLLEKLAASKLKKKVVVFGATRKGGEGVERSNNLELLSHNPFQTVSIVGKTWPLHLKHVLRVSREENLAIIEESIAYLQSFGKKIIYDAEHFFDAFAEDPDYALECLLSARGAKWITLCDTNGAHLPRDIAKATAAAKELGLEIGIHTHNDTECAVANSLAAVEAGARLVQGTINGLGERCGNANLSSLLPNLEIKENYKTVGRKNLQKLTSVSTLVAEITKQSPPLKQAYVGSLAFTHKGGMHTSAIRKNTSTFEHIAPESVGNKSNLTLSELAGRASIEEKLQEMKIKRKDAGKLLARLKDMEDKGYTYEQAEGSLYLFLKEEDPLFRIDDFRVKSNPSKSKASIQISNQSSVMKGKGKGKGPVEALDKALRKALRPIYPEISYMSLTDYRVHIINSEKGTKAVTRVFIDASDGDNSWTTMGVSGNIIESSLEALHEAYLYLLQK